MQSGGRLVFAGTQSGVGKTTLSLGVMGALGRMGLSVKPFKVGPDYIDPQFHSFVTGSPSRNLDSYLLEEDILKGLFIRGCEEGDIAVIEGVMGLFDGFGNKSDTGSTAHVAKLLRAPVILIINGSGVSTSAAAMVLGYQHFDPNVNIKGVIINQVSGEKHYKLLKEAIEGKTGIKCFGYLNSNSDIQLKSRHLGLIPTQEVGDLKEKLNRAIDMVEETIDLKGLLETAYKAEKLSTTDLITVSLKEPISIAYAYDKAFNFYYQDNLDLLRDAGVNLIPFSPMESRELPTKLHGIYIGGGFPEVFAGELERNAGIRRQILSLAIDGIPIFAECGGYMYLTKGIRDLHGKEHEMVGILEGKAVMTNRLQRFGYNNVTILDNCCIGQGVEIKGHEFHRAVVEAPLENPLYHVRKLKDEELVAEWHCGQTKYNCIAGFPHFHFYSNLNFIKDFLNRCIEYKHKQGGCKCLT